MKKTHRFKIRFRGYDKSEVEAHLYEMQKLYDAETAKRDKLLKEAKDEINLLKGEIRRLESKEDEVAAALEDAIKRGREIEKCGKLRYALEGERIKLFRNKWERLVEEGKLSKAAKSRGEKLIGFLYAEEKILLDMMADAFHMAAEPESRSAVNEQYIEESKRLIDKLKSEKSA